MEAGQNRVERAEGMTHGAGAGAGGAEAGDHVQGQPKAVGAACRMNRAMIDADRGSAVTMAR